MRRRLTWIYENEALGVAKNDHEQINRRCLKCRRYQATLAIYMFADRHWLRQRLYALNQFLSMEMPAMKAWAMPGGLAAMLCVC